MTEDEAKTKWCPQARCAAENVRGHLLDAAGFNRMNHDAGWTSAGSRCIASDCMAWRWSPRYGTNPENPAEAMTLPPTDGYCGLSGVPHA
jgi:hypothetical protein